MSDYYSEWDDYDEYTDDYDWPYLDDDYDEPEYEDYYTPPSRIAQLRWSLRWRIHLIRYHIDKRYRAKCDAEAHEIPF